VDLATIQPADLQRALDEPTSQLRGDAADRVDQALRDMHSCRKECITYANTYAPNGILTRDSRDVAMLLQRLSTL
jgi:hypothetical protein